MACDLRSLSFFSFPSHLFFCHSWPKCGIPMSWRDLDVLCEWNVPRKGFKADQMTSSHFSARPILLLLWTSIAKATFLSLSSSLLGFFSFSSILYALSLGLLGGSWLSHLDAILIPRLRGTREQPKWQISWILSGKIEPKINFKVQRSRAHGRIILVYRSFLLDDQPSFV